MEETPRDEQWEIRERTFRFAVRIIKVVNAVPRSTSGMVVSRQLARSGSSVGANVEEAKAAHTRKEFIRKMNIARAEAHESHYWLRLMAATELVPDDRLTEITSEANEIVSVLTAIVKNARRNEKANE